jgi:hypothetical protein
VAETGWKEHKYNMSFFIFTILALNGYKFADSQNIEDLFREYVMWKGRS